MNNDPESDTNKEINFFRSGVDTPSVACPGVVMGVVHFPFQPQGELYVSLLPSLQFYLQKRGHSRVGGIVQQRFRDGIQLSHADRNVVFSN